MKGKIVLVPFPFTDLTAAKLRPALVIHEGDRDVVTAFISSKIPSKLYAVDILIKDLVNLIVKLTGFNGKVMWDDTKPDGQPRRMLDVTRAEKEFGFKAKTHFEDGLRKTIDWYIKNSSNLLLGFELSFPDQVEVG